jgi:glucose/mannose transport system permease protein
MQQALPAKAQAARRKAIQSDRLIAFLMILPSLIAIAVFVYGFIGYTTYTSFSNYTTPKPDYSWAGLNNYVTIIKDARFQENIRNLLVFTILFLVACLALGLVLALLVDSRIKGESFFRSVYLFPMAVSFIVTGVAWRWLFTPGNLDPKFLDPTGINLIFQKLGLTFLQSQWIADNRVLPGWSLEMLKTRLLVPMAMIPVVVAAVWQMSGFCMAMFLAGLRGISDEVKEAARVDGASESQVFWQIVFPMLRPVTLSAIVVLAHISLKIFDLVLTMTGGGPGNKTEVPGVLMYDLRFEQLNTAESSVVAVFMLFLVSLLILPYLIGNRRAQEAEA